MKNGTLGFSKRLDTICVCQRTGQLLSAKSDAGQLYRYLFYSLKKSGYEAVYFGKNTRESMKSATWMTYRPSIMIRSVRRGLLKRFSEDRGSGDGDTDCWTSVQTAPDVMEKLFYSIAGSRKRTALVVPMTVFDHFFSNNARTKELLERNRRQGHSGNLVLLTASIKSRRKQ